MRKFLINVNGTSYEVEVEELAGGTSAPVAAPAPVATPAPAPAPAAAPAPQAPAGGEKVNAPMPGTIADVKVKVGDTVKKGDVVVILEAMKMENEIMAANGGTVTAVLTSKGASVNTGDALVVIG